MSDTRGVRVWPFVGVCGLALVLGGYARFKGLGFSPVGIDEYYLSRAIDSILKYGLPAFDCGGFYERGIVLQYLIAGLRLLGMSPELAPRFVAAVSSLAVFPAVYLLAARITGRRLALISVALVAVSMWQIEVARFGRFYAPFQAIFLWYLVYLLRLTVDGERRAWRGMLWLTLASALVWEGGIFLAVLNFVPFLLQSSEPGAASRLEWKRIVLLMLFLGVIFLVVGTNLRFVSDIPPFPTDFSESALEYPQFRLDEYRLPVVPVGLGWQLALGALALANLAAAAHAALRHRAHLALSACLAVAHLAAIFHLYALVVLAFVLLRSLGATGSASLVRGEWRVRAALLLAPVGLWLLYGAVDADWEALSAGSGGFPGAVAVVVFQLVRFPEVIVQVVRPLWAAAPLQTVLMFSGFAVVAWRSVIRSVPLRDPANVLFLVVVLLLFAIGASGPPRQETRYSFFLYPLMLIFVVFAARLLSDAIAPRRFAVASAAILAVAAFASTEDWNPRHVVHIDSRESTFRLGMTPERQAHLGEARDDYRSVAAWLDTHVDAGRDVVVNGVHGLDYYFSGTRYFYANHHSTNYRDWACHRGSVERWTNLPLLPTYADVGDKVPADGKGYVITWTFEVSAMSSALAAFSPRLVFTEGTTAVVELTRK